MTGTLSVQTLGRLRIKLDGTAVSGFASRKAAALLVYLAGNPRPHPRDLLATLLWDSTLQQRALGNLSVILSSLRKQLAPFLISSRHEIGINPNADIELDAAIFAQTLTVVRRQHPHRHHLTLAAVSRLMAATDLYQGDFLAGFHMRQAAGFEEWVYLERERLQRLAIDTLDSITTFYLAQGNYAEGIAQATRLINLDSLREQSHCHLMRLLAANGQRHAALTQYETCRRILEDELGVEPVAATRALYTDIRDDQLPGSPAAGTAGPIPSIHLPLHNLPAQTTPFIGRDAELKQIGERLQNDDCRLLTLVGPGGIGKTRLAIQAVIPAVHEYSHGVWFVSLAGVSAAETLVSALADVLNFSFAGTAVPETQLLNYLRQKEMLIIFDNFEHLLDEGVALPLAILQNAPAVKLLVTSRERLNVGAEWLLPIAGLDYPTHGRMPPAARYSAVDLFVQSAQQVQPDFKLMPETETAVVQLCQLVQGMPLGVKLAAAWVEMLSPAEILAEIKHNLDFLETTRRDLPPRQRSIRAVYDASWQHLSEREQSVFPQLSVFRGGFTGDAAKQVAGTTLVDLRGFLDKSLLHRQENGRYEMHELLRQYAADYLQQPATTAETVHERHTAYYAAVLQQQYPQLYGRHQRDVLAAIETDIENARIAWHWAESHVRFDILAQMVDALGIYFEWRGQYQEGLTLCQSVIQNRGDLAAPNEVLSILPPDVWPVFSVILTWAGRFNAYLVQYERAEAQIKQALAILDSPPMPSPDTRKERAFVLSSYGSRIIDSKDQFEKGRQMLAQSLALSEAIDDDIGMARALTYLSGACWQNGEYAKGKELIQEAMTMQKAQGNAHNLAGAMMMKGLFLLYEEQLAESEALFLESLTIMRRFNDLYDMATNLNNLGVCRMFSGQFQQAFFAWQEARDIAESLGTADEVAHYETNMGLAEMFLGHYEQAAVFAEKSLKIAQAVGYHRVLGTGRILLGGISAGQGDFWAAYEQLKAGEAVYRRMMHQDELAMVLGLNALVARALGRHDEASQLCAEAVRLVLDIGPFGPQIVTLLAWALLLADQADYRAGIMLYEVARKRPFVNRSPWFAHIATDALAAIKVTCPADVVAKVESCSLSAPAETIIQKLAAEWE